MAPPHLSATGPTRARGQSFALQFGLLVFLPLAAVAVAIPLASLSLHARAMRQLVAERDQRAVQAAATSLRERLEHQAIAIQGLALYAAASPAAETALASYRYLLPDFSGGLALYDSGGQVLATTTSADEWANRPVAELEARLDGGAGVAFSGVFTAPVGLMVLVGARAGTGLLAVGAVDPGDLAQGGLAALYGAAGEVSLWIVDPRGHVIYRQGPPAPEAELANHPGVVEALRGETGATYLPLAGSEHVVAYAPVEPVGWALVLEEPWEAVDNPLLRSTLAAPLILIPVILIALVALAFGLRQIVLPLRRLAGSAGELGRGRYDPVEVPVGGIAEIRHLQAELVHMARQVRAAQQSLRGYVSAVTRGQEDERRRLARELHDGPVQALIALDQRVQLLQLRLKTAAPEAAERLAELRQMTGALLGDLRRVIRALRPIYLEDLGLLPALEMLAQDLERSEGIRVTFRSQGPPARLTPERELAAYRVAQEALSNVARHSRAKQAEVTAVFEPDLFTLGVVDNGRGFSLPERLAELTEASHFGLVGMHERAELVAGRVSIRSAPGQGTSVELRLPLAG